MKIIKSTMLIAALLVSILAVTVHAQADTIDTKDYATISDAFAALKDGDTLVLTENREFDEPIDIDGAYKWTSAVLDLNGNTLTSNVEDGLDSILVTANHELTIKDSSETSGKFIITGESDICVDAATFTLESGTIEAKNNAYYALWASSQADYPILRPAIINIRGGVIDCCGVAVAPLLFCNFNMTGGTIKGDMAAMEIGGVRDFYTSTITISGGAIDGQVYVNVIEENPNTYAITGGTFNDKNFVDTYVDSSLIRDMGNGIYAVGAEAAATVETENLTQKVIGDTKATGFVTTISSSDTIELKTIKWTVSADNTTKNTPEYKLSGTVTLNGDAKIGLVVEDIADANATAAATVNGYITE